MTNEQVAMLEFLKWASGGLLGVVGGLIVYIWLDHRGRDKEDKDGIKAAFGQAIGEVKKIADGLTTALKDLGDSVGKRIDDVEAEQVRQGKEIVAVRQYTRGIVKVCEERGRHCRMFAPGEGEAHFHRRMGEQGIQPHQRCSDSCGETESGAVDSQD